MKNETTIICVRHGESDANVRLASNPHLMGGPRDTATELLINGTEEPALTQLGIEQSKHVAARLAPVLCEALAQGTFQLFCSPLLRARQTCAEFQRDGMPLANVDVATDVELLQIEYSITTHQSTDEFVKQIQDLFWILNTAATCATQHKTILLIGHSMVISTLLHFFATHYAGIEPADHYHFVRQRVARQSNHLSVVYYVSNCSTSVIKAKQSKRGNATDCDWTIYSIGEKNN